ncbi:hypothetical protein [Catalinimonas locisalis]
MKTILYHYVKSGTWVVDKRVDSVVTFVKTIDLTNLKLIFSVCL